MAANDVSVKNDMTSSKNTQVTNTFLASTSIVGSYYFSIQYLYYSIASTT